MRVLAIGDVHSKWHKVGKIFRHELYAHPDTLVLSTGDLCSYEYPFPVELLFSPGNHDRRKGVAALQKHPYLHPLTTDNGVYAEQGVRFAGIAGTEQPKGKTDRQPRFFCAEDIGKLRAAAESLDVLITHEAPAHPTLQKPNSKSGELQFIGSSLLTNAIKELQPPFAFFGHHHIYHHFSIGETEVIGLPLPHHGYVLLDSQSGRHELIGAQLDPMHAYRYLWEAEEDAAAQTYAKTPKSLADGFVLLREKRSAEAEVAFTANALPHPHYHYGLATALFQQMGETVEFTIERFATAARHYRLALLLDPTFADAHLLYGDLLTAQAKLEDRTQATGTAAQASHHHKVARALNPTFGVYPPLPSR